MLWRLVLEGLSVMRCGFGGGWRGGCSALITSILGCLVEMNLGSYVE